MAEESKNNIRISRTNTGFPDYLDFEVLRKEGIEYLGKLGGKLWTDHNVHDPGITILEVLCYALLDLGYRTNLPVKDLLSRSQTDSTADNNFFTQSAILSCNPLTIIDLRKLLIDIKGVRNAWLEVATDQKDICRPPIPRNNSRENEPMQEPCMDYLNGLYHVYIDLENNVEKEDEPYVIEKVKSALMAHRNLCEDFVDIFILCKKEIGVCADITLEEDIDAEKVYLAVIEKLRGFFTPSPTFYTLQQLLDKQKSIEEIFSGRPYNVNESHGFVDVEELELLTLRKEIHLSDIYNVLLGIEGVKSVNKLRLQTCKGDIATPVGGWKYQIPENHIPEFSIKCSGFQFTRRGAPVSVDFKKFDGLFEINFIHNGKILYHTPSPYLDGEIPKGVYREDLKEYYSIQNELPHVYGIADGGLPENASSKRRAEAYQLKAYLLFFDQLLANYLGQLSSIRSLFALSAPEKSHQHTYFINQLTTVPELQKLLRFNVSETASNTLGATGSILAIPVDRKYIIELKNQDKLKTLEIDTIQPYTFQTRAEQDIAIHLLRNDLHADQHQCECVTKNNDCVFYYILTSSADIVLLSKKYFRNSHEANQEAASVKYIGTFEENYRSFSRKDKKVSFDIELNLLSFAKYLELIVEDKTLFQQRRYSFQNHLLARFAEQFTDYALLSFGTHNIPELKDREIKSKERFLSGYDELSSNRGKAYDYAKNNWNNNNISGVEKKFKALSGIENWKRHSLCNFVVDRYQQQFIVTLKIAGTDYFTTEDKFESRDEALKAAQAVFKALKKKSNYQTDHIVHDNVFKLRINYAPDRWAIYPMEFASKQESVTVASNLTNLLSDESTSGSILESGHVYVPSLIDSKGNQIRKSTEVYPSDEKAKAGALKSIKKIDDPKKWEYEESRIKIGTLHQDLTNTLQLSFINPDAFKIHDKKDTVGKPDEITYNLLDRGNNFKIKATEGFEKGEQVRDHAFDLLTILTDDTRYQVIRGESAGKFLLNIHDKGNVVTNYEIESLAHVDDPTNLKKLIHDYVRENQYFITIDKIPTRWKFSYKLGHEPSSQYSFQSVDEYNSDLAASIALNNFIRTIDTLEIKETEDGLFLIPQKRNNELISVKWQSETGGSPTSKRKSIISALLEEQKELKHLASSETLKAFEESVKLDPESEKGLFVYRLVDKDRVPAFYTKAYKDKNSATADLNAVVNVSQKGIRHLKLCLGGDVIVERKHPGTNVIWYRYQVKAVNQLYENGPHAGNPIVLFESAKRFVNREEAEKAFIKDYLHIIHLASTASAYGKEISLVEIPVEVEDQSRKTESIAFVTKETFEYWNSSPVGVVGQIVRLALTYPIRIVPFKSKEFYTLFPCEKKEDDESDNEDCKSNQEKYVYYFTFLLNASNEAKWQSLNFYETPTEATKEFEFFFLLLKYAGNYYVDCSDCDDKDNPYRISIREVLAESVGRFATEEQAWGNHGVQKFICTSQSENAFHTYRRKEDCCLSFYVACNNGLVYHPCRYDTPEKRDEALLKLYQSLKEWKEKKLWQTAKEKDRIVLHEASGIPFAEINVNDSRGGCLTDRIALVIDHANAIENYKEIEGKIVLQNSQHGILVSSIQEGTTITAWRDLLITFGCYYPIQLKKDEKDDKKVKYDIEIKLPGFNSCSDVTLPEKPCGCGNDIREDLSDCYVAWKSNCLYTTCSEAEETLDVILRLLMQYEFYQPVFDCECYSYGIAVQISWKALREPADVWNQKLISGEIIAFNPQCYAAKEEACEAVNRAKALINGEGLHLVEHILLRPRCFPDDCRCREYIKRCEDETHCSFVWQPQNEDPCVDEGDICFVPGQDRYSFIATVALPAWPSRFRTAANRQLLENLLYRETPAHVLLRIQWLAPHDFCCFENRYKKWNRWLAGKSTCIGDFNVCEFMDFLFNRNYECLSECKVCEPCQEIEEQRLPCFATNVDKRDIKFLDQVNDLYCWQEQDCNKYQFAPCDPSSDRVDPIFIRTEPRDEPALPPLEDEDLILRPAPSKAVDEKKEEASWEKKNILNRRRSKYNEMALQITEKSKNNPVAGKVQSFLLDPQPSPARIEKLVTEILENKSPKNKESKKLSKRQVNDLVQCCISSYLDKIYFLAKDIKKVHELKKVIEKIKTAKINMSAIYSSWDPAEVMKHDPDLNNREIDKLFGR